MKILVTGGAGYIGSFMTKRLLNDGHEVFVADSLERGHKDMLDSRAVFYQGNLQETSFVTDLFKRSHYDSVMHFAAYISVGESMQHPGMYLHNNVFSTVLLLEQMHEHNIKHFIFSSTGTVYGIPEVLPTPEDHPKRPENPYAETKLMVERILHWYYQVHGIGYGILRYFNACGAALDGSMGEDHEPETHLIPCAIHAAITNTEFSLFGTDYNTTDGSAVRDYIHVLDLIDAHILTLKKLQESQGEYIYNVGTGKGLTNKEIIKMVQKVSGVTFPIIEKSRRPGDVAETVADTRKIASELGFSPQYSELETIITSAWKWHASRKNRAA